jgi:Protein of unknown function (DUF3800)
MHSDFIVFADESGDHSLAKINADYPVFVLSFCIFLKTDYVEAVCPLLQRFKLRWWAHDGVVLHSMRIRRQELPFVFLKTFDKREHFMADLTDTLARCPFTIIAAVIDKTRLREQYLQPENPYSLALKFCLERVHHFFRDRGQVFRKTAFLFECRGKREDAELARIFRRLCERANHRGRMPGYSIEFFEKKANLPGLQIADLVSTPIGRRVLHPHAQNRAFEIIQHKFDRGPNGDAMGWGLQVFP